MCYFPKKSIIFKDMNIIPIYQMPFRSAFLLFIIFSFIGWCSEVLYVGIFYEHKFVNRGFLHGPICPIYGFGGCAIMLLPPKILATWVPLFFLSMFLCSVVEYFISWLLEKLFNTLWWDYSHYKFNINGRVCLLNSLLFGAMGILSVHFVIPPILYVLNLLSEKVIEISSTVIAFGLSADLLMTVRRLVDFSTTMERIKTLSESLKDQFGHEEWFRDNSLIEMVNSVREKAAAERSKLNEKLNQERLKINDKLLERIDRLMSHHKNVESYLKRFPTMKSHLYKDGIAIIRQHIKEFHNKKK